ncbi:hypothetical protein B0H63DRAFT_489362 [Podospora didyma]|uniref:Zn(2)-C6 fungal-type domain-containing protein n=1 Tax=Podospora didyma TaxID=330526 RepID=A0AAE0K196_9PEZI|nr:hypothetical protein B0H63DRAFT_489362 [Podospora didyma]
MDASLELGRPFMSRSMMEPGYGGMNRPFQSGPTPEGAASANGGGQGLGQKACGPCAKIKTKCIYREGGAGCERCHRLKKECVPSTLIRRHKVSKGQQGASSRVLRLEEKLDDLVSFLRAEKGRAAGGVADQDDVDDEGDEESDNGDDEDSSPPVALPTPAPTLDTARSAATYSTAASTPPDWNFPAAEEPSQSEAEESMKKFREETVLFFPFHYIPPYISSRQLLETFPFLWLNIMSTTSRSNKRRLALGDQVRNIIFRKIVVEREKNLDLLLGLLASLGWSHLQRREKFYQSLFSQLIVLMIYDMGLQQPPPAVPQKAFCGPQLPSGRQDRTNDERRAVLGAFLITSMASLILKGPDGLRWSSHLDNYATYLTQNSDLDQDKSLVALVRMQLIVNQIHSAPRPITNVDNCEIYLSALKSQLQSIMKSEHLSSAAANHPAVLEHFHFTELLILESSIGQGPRRPDDLDLRRFEIYQGQLNSIRAWLNTFHSTDFRFYGDMAFFSYSELVKVMVGLHKLTTLDDPTWYRPAVRKTLDLMPQLDKLIATFEQLRAATALWSPGIGEDAAAFSWAITVFQNMKNTWKDEVTGLDEINTVTSGNFLDGDDQSSLLSTYLPAYGNGDAWLSDMFNI